MKKLMSLAVLMMLISASPARAYLQSSVSPPLTNSRAMYTDSDGLLSSSSTTSAELAFVHGVTSAIQDQLDAVVAGSTFGTFTRTCQITSAAGATAVHCLNDADVTGSKKAYLTSFQAKVNGSTQWATTATCAIQDTNGTPVSFVTFAVADMTANAVFFPGAGAATTYGNAYILGSGGTAAKGLDIKCNANGTGSTFVVTVTGFIK